MNPYHSNPLPTLDRDIQKDKQNPSQPSHQNQGTTKSTHAIKKSRMQHLYYLSTVEIKIIHMQ